MKAKTLILLALCLCMLSCTQKRNILSQYPVSRDIDEMQDAGIDLGNVSEPLAMLTIGDYVVIAQDKDESMITVFNVKTGTAHHLLPRGHGENEVLDVHQMQARDATSFYVYDFFSKKLLTFELGKHDTFEVSSQEIVDDYLSLSIDSDTLFVGNCVESDFRYKLYDKHSGSRKYFGSYEDFGLDPNSGKILLQGNILNDDTSNRFVWLSFYGTAWQVVSYTDSAKVIHTKVFDLPKFQTLEGGGQPIFDVNTKIGFISVTSSQECIYALYSGHDLAEVAKGKGQVMRGRDIFMLDWDGNVKGRMHTSEKVVHIACNKEKGCLFFLCDTAEGFRLKYIRL